MRTLLIGAAVGLVVTLLAQRAFQVGPVFGVVASVLLVAVALVVIVALTHPRAR